MPIGTPSRLDILLFVEIPIVLVVLGCIGLVAWMVLL
jgi:hypothetical protein